MELGCKIFTVLAQSFSSEFLLQLTIGLQHLSLILTNLTREHRQKTFVTFNGF